MNRGSVTARLEGHGAAFTALGLLCLVVAASKGLPAIRRWEHDRTIAASRATSLADKLRHGVEQRRSTERALNEWRRRGLVDDSAFFLTRELGSVGAELVGRLRAFATAEGVVMQSVQPRIDSTRTRGIVLASAHVSATADVQGLMGFLTRLERAKPLFRVVDLAINQTEATPTDDKPDVLKIDITVQGIGKLQPGKPNAARE